MRQVGGYAGLRQSFLLSLTSKLGKDYPPALDALRLRRDQDMQRFSANPTDTDALMDTSALNRALGERERTLALFNSLRPGDQNRGYLAHEVRDALIASQRYGELTDALPFRQMTMFFDVMAEKLPKMPPQVQEKQKRELTERAAQEIEALAGAGDLAHAKDYVGKVLRLDTSPETYGLLRRHLGRAGHQELVPVN